MYSHCALIAAAAAAVAAVVVVVVVVAATDGSIEKDNHQKGEEGLGGG